MKQQTERYNSKNEDKQLLDRSKLKIDQKFKFVFVFFPVTEFRRKFVFSENADENRLERN